MDDLGGSFVGIAGTNADEVRANHNDWSANAGPSMHDLYQICQCHRRGRPFLAPLSDPKQRLWIHCLLVIFCKLTDQSGSLRISLNPPYGIEISPYRTTFARCKSYDTSMICGS